MRKNSKDYFISIIRKNAGGVIEFVSKLNERKSIQIFAYNESHKLLDYYGLISGKKYSLKWLKEESERSEKLLRTAIEGKNYYFE